MPDTSQNQACYPQQGQQRPGAGFPLARLVTVISLAHGTVLDAAMGLYQGKGTGEHSLFRQLGSCFDKGDVMLADSYYCSYFLIVEMLGRGVDVVFEQHGARKTDFRRGKRLGAREHRVCCSRPGRPEWMDEKAYNDCPDEIQMREVKVGKKILVTTFLSPRKMARAELENLYQQRWNV